MDFNSTKLISISIIAFAFFTISCTREPLAESPSPVKTHEIPFTEQPLVIDGRLDEIAWANARSVGPFEFPWWESGAQEQTEAKLLWDDEYLYVSFVCEDAHIWAKHDERDSPVYKDDCVEVFTSPNPGQLQVYYNIEMNVLGVSLDHIHPEGPGSKAHWDPQLIIKTTVDGTLNDDSDTDTRWILEAAIPFQSFAEVAKNTPPQPGDEWRLNLHRLGGNTNLQWSQWNPAVADTVLFHAPEYFGRVVFTKETAR